MPSLLVLLRSLKVTPGKSAGICCMIAQVLSLEASLTMMISRGAPPCPLGEGLFDDAFDDGGEVAFFVVDGDEDGEGLMGLEGAEGTRRRWIGSGRRSGHGSVGHGILY